MWVTEQSELNISADQLEFDIYDNPRGKPNCQGKILIADPFLRHRAAGLRSSSI